MFGSHYGAKSGPLEATRAFIVRFDETAIDGKPKKADAPFHIVRRPFQLHRKLNALAMDYPGSRNRPCEHSHMKFPHDLGALRAGQAADLGDHGVGGLAPWHDKSWYYAYDSEDRLERAVPLGA